MCLSRAPAPGGPIGSTSPNLGAHSMNRASQSEPTNAKTACRAYRGVVAALFFLVAANVSGHAQQGSSLGEIARQARTEKQAQPKTEANQAQQVADELSEDQNDGGAPGGFKTYNAGDYKIWVPAPYTVAHDDAGVVLSGPMAGSKRPIVLLGTALVDHFPSNDAFLQDTATQLTRLYTESAKCTKTSTANHGASQCGLAAATLLGQRVSGNAVFVRALGNIYPVFCVTATDSRAREILNNPHSNYHEKAWARESLAREDEDVRSVWQKCESVFQSIRFGERAASASKGADSNGQAAGVDPERARAGGSSAASGGPGSLADIARQLHESPGAEVKVPVQPVNAVPAESTIPDGFKAQAFNYCKNPTQCWDASVLVPADAQLVSSDCRQYVFEIKVHGTPFLLLAGSAGTGSCGRSADDAGQVRWKQLVDPESARGPGTSSTISSQQMKLDGKSAVVTKIKFRKGLDEWIAKRAEVDSNGGQLVVGCMALRDTFAEGDAICSGLIESLRLP